MDRGFVGRVLVLAVCLLLVSSLASFAQGTITMTMDELGQSFQTDMLSAFQAIAPYLFKVGAVACSIFFGLSLMRGIAFRV